MSQEKHPKGRGNVVTFCKETLYFAALVENAHLGVGGQGRDIVRAGKEKLRIRIVLEAWSRSMA